MAVWLWLVTGATIGFLVSSRPMFSMPKCVAIGMLLGPFAVALFFVPAGTPEPVKCSYCAQQITTDARVCQHCGAILITGW